MGRRAVAKRAKSPTILWAKAPTETGAEMTVRVEEKLHQVARGQVRTDESNWMKLVRTY